MASSSTAAPVTPRPGLPKTIGALNLIFGLSLFLCGLGCLNRYSSLDSEVPGNFGAEEWQVVFDRARQELVSDLEAREKEAILPAQKAALKRQQLELQGPHPKVTDRLDLKKLERHLSRLKWYLWAEVISSPVVNLLLLASGIGLLQLKNWARIMAIWIAAIKIVRLAVLRLFLMIVVIPHLTAALEMINAVDPALSKAVIAKAIAAQNAQQGTTPPPTIVESKDFIAILTAMGHIYAVFSIALGTIYPAVALVVLTRPAAAAACSDESESDSEESSGSSW